MSDRFLGSVGGPNIIGGSTPNIWFDGNDLTAGTVNGNTSNTWTAASSGTVATVRIRWAYGTYGGGAAAAFKLYTGSSLAGPWTEVLADSDPVTTAGASYPGDFEHTYTLSSPAGSSYWKFSSTTIGNNDIYTINGYGTDAGVLADWDDNGFGGLASDDDLSGDVESWVITRGASAEITGGAQVGSCRLMLINRADDRYNPANTGGPLYGKLVDGVPLWIGANSDGALSGTDPRGLFAGRLRDITPLPVPGATYAPRVELTAEDCLGWYARTPVTLAYAEGRAQGAYRAALLTAAGETRTSLAHEIATMPLSGADTTLLRALEELNAANGTRHLCKPADAAADWYDYTTRNRQWRLDATSDGTLDAAADHVTDTSGWRLSADTVTNRQRATVTPVTFTPSTVTVWEADSLPVEVTTARPYTVTVAFDDYTASPTLDTASTGSALTANLTATAESAAVSLTVASGTATVTALSIEGRLARRGPDETWVANDTTSQAGSRGIREGSPISGEVVGTLASARGIAEHVVWRYGNPQFRPTVTVVNWLPEMFELDLYDVISFTSSQLGVTDRLFEIVGLTLEGRVAASSTVRHHVATYVLQECRVQADPGWFILDTSVLTTGTDILAY